MSPLVPSPYDKRISRYEARLEAHPKKKTEFLRNRIKNLKGKRDIYAFNNRPDTPLPFNAGYENAVNAANQQRTDAYSGAASERYGIENQYGLNNSDNPLSQAAQMERAFRQRTMGTGNTLAARGQLYSGALERAQSSNRLGHAVDLDNLAREYQSRLAEIKSPKEIEQEYSAALTTAGDKRLEEAANEEVDPSEAPMLGKAGRQLKQKYREKIAAAKKAGKDKKARKLTKKFNEIKGV